jgi:hypothetical protein
MNEPAAKPLLARRNNSTLVRFLLLVASGAAVVQILPYCETVIVIFTFAAIVAFSFFFVVGSNY